MRTGILFCGGYAGKALSGQALGVALGGWVVRGCPDEGRGRAFYFVADMREKPCRGKRRLALGGWVVRGCPDEGREDGLKKAAAAWEGIPSGQATTSVAWRLDD